MAANTKQEYIQVDGINTLLVAAGSGHSQRFFIAARLGGIAIVGAETCGGSARIRAEHGEHEKTDSRNDNQQRVGQRRAGPRTL